MRHLRVEDRWPAVEQARPVVRGTAANVPSTSRNAITLSSTPAVTGNLPAAVRDGSPVRLVDGPRTTLQTRA